MKKLTDFIDLNKAIELQAMKLHNPFMLAGTSYGDTLPGNKGQLKMWWIRELKEYWVESNKGYAGIPATNVAHFEPVQAKYGPRIENTHKPVVNPVNAQIGGPMDAFNAQVETPITKEPKKPGRPPKYQGQDT